MAHHPTSTTTTFAQSLNTLAQETLDQYKVNIKDIHESWLEGFMVTCKEVGKKKRGGVRQPMTELLKTPGRSRVDAKPLFERSATKDPIATLLFPVAPVLARSTSSSSSKKQDKENETETIAQSNKKGRSILSTSTSARGSPMRDVVRSSPKIGLSKSMTASTSRNMTTTTVEEAEMQVDVNVNVNVVSPPHSPTKMVMDDSPTKSKQQTLSAISHADPESEADLDLLQLVEDSTALENDLEMAEGEQQVQEEEQVANLSIIGEEEEDNSMTVDPASVSVPQPSSSSLILPETQPQSASIPTPPPSALLPEVTQPLSPRTSATSSTAAEADAVPASDSEDDADVDMAVPLNDDPSLVRPASSLANHRASAPVVNSNRTPGGTTSTLRYGAGSYSANKPGLSGINSSSPPPPMAMVGGSQPFRPSANGGAKLNFVGLPKKSFPMALGLNRSLVGKSGSFVGGTGGNGEEGSQDSIFGGSSQSTVASNGGVKRKSMEGNDGPHKVVKKEEANVGNTRVGELKARLQNLRKSSMSAATPGLGLGVGLGQSTSKFNPRNALSASTSTSTISTMIHPPPAPLPLSPKLASASSFAPPPSPRPTSPKLPNSPKFASSQIPQLSPSKAVPTPSLARRPSNSVNELVKNFERNHDARLPSPTKMPVRVESPRKATTSSTAIPRPASPTPRMNLRSPTSQSRTIESVMKSPAPAPAPPQKILSPKPAKMLPKHLAEKASTTPRGSPPPLGGRTLLEQLDLTKADADDEMDDDDEENDAVAVEQQLRGDNGKGKRGSSLALEEAEAEKEKRLMSLPRAISPSPTTEVDEDDEEMVVEKGRGALASALDEGDAVVQSVVKTQVIKASPSKIVMPGTFGAEDDEEEEEDNGTQVIEDSQAPSRDLNGKKIVKKVSTASFSSNGSSSNGTGSMVFRPFGTNQAKKGDAPKAVKSLQVAAALAKKEQADKERKAALKEDIAQKKLAMAQKKQEEERQKAEEERKIKAEALEKRRKEREEAAAKAARINRAKAKDESKKPVGSTRPLNASQSQSNLNSSVGRSALNNSTNGNLNASTKSNANASSMVGVKYMSDSIRVVGGPSNGSGIARPGGPSKLATSQGASSQQNRPPQQPQPRSEPEVYEELPDINSEYSDSGDEGRAEKEAALPDWARSPHIKNALEAQGLVNPDDVFGAIPPLSMKEIFRGNNMSRFAKRTSSACWEGVDALSEAEKARYNIRMGYSSTSTSTTQR